MICIGIDGCRGGWLFTLIDAKQKLSLSLIKRLDDALDLLKKAQRVYIDMPIGLVKEKGEIRDIDVQIRKELGHPFSSSVFTVPCQQAVYASDYYQANQINKDVLGKGISIQAWNICPKIKELDIFLCQNSGLKSKFIETHPELCFKHLKGSSLSYKKKTKEGKEERIKLLQTQLPEISLLFQQFRKQFLKKDVADDDILDSLVLGINDF